MATRWLGDLSADEIAAISARNRASRVHKADTDGNVATTDTTLAKPVPEAIVARSDKESGHSGVAITLPWPPTVNHYWLPARNGKLYISQKGLSFRARVKMLAHGHPMTKGAVSVSISAHPPDKRRRDLDNILKACLDALQHAGLIEDDSNVNDLRITRADRIKDGAVEVTITAQT